MKKLFIVLSLAIISALALGACANNGTNGTPVGTNVVPGTGSTAVVPGTGVTPLATNSVIGTPLATNSVVGTPLATNSVVGTPLATNSVVGTPMATNAAGVANGQAIYRLSNLLGANVVPTNAYDTTTGALTDNNAVFGTIDSFLVDPQSGDIVYALVNPGQGIVNPQTGLLVIPYSALNLAPRVAANNTTFNNEFHDTYTTDLTAQQLASAPYVNVDNLDLTNPNFDGTWRDYYTGLNYQIPALNQNGLFRINSFNNIFTDTDVVNTAGDEVGDVANVLVNPDQGSLSYMVISDGGFLGIGENYTPIPWQALNYQPQPQQFVVDTSAVDFNNAPSITNLNDLNTLGPDWQNQYNSFWGVTPGAAAPAANATPLVATATP